MTQIKKHFYEKPAMRVLILDNKLNLLAGSGDSREVNVNEETTDFQW